MIAYKADPDYSDYRVAGLGFVPIIDTISQATLMTGEHQINYVTTGLRAILILWKGQVNANGQNDPSEIAVYGFGELGKACTISAVKNEAKTALPSLLDRSIVFDSTMQ